MNTKKKLSKTDLKNRLNKYLVLIAMLLSIGVWGQWTYDFGTGTGTFTSSTASTSFLPTPTSGTSRVRVGTNPGSFVLANPGISLGTNSELQFTSNTGSASTSKFSIYDYTASKIGYVKYKIAFNGGTNGVYNFTIGDGATFGDNNAISTAQIFSGIEFSLLASNAVTYKVLNNTTYGTTGISNSTTLFSQSTSNEYLIEAYMNNNTTSTNYVRSGTSYSLASSTWDLWVNGTKVGTNLAKGGLASNVNIDSFAFNHQASATTPGIIYLDDLEYSNTLPTAPACAAPSLSSITSAGSVTTSTANLTGDITSQGGAGLTTRAFEYSTNSGLTPSSTITDALTATGSYTLGLTLLTPNTRYYYRAYAINACSTPQTGYSHTSSYPSFTTLSNAPTTTAATALTTTGFQANWTAPTGGGSESFTYEIQIDNNNDFSSPEVNQTGITTLNYSAGPLSSGTTYYYRVRTLNASGNSAWSNITPVTTNTPAIPVVTSETFNGTVGTSFSASITATNSPTSYSYTGTLPGGLTFSTATGAITGTPTTATVSAVSISVTATNGVGPSAPATISFNIAKGNQTITGLPTTQSKVYGDVDYTLSATTSSALTVTYTSSDPTVATVTGNTVSIKKVGTTTITASQAGDSNWNAATNATQTLTVTAKGLTISGLSGVSKVYDKTTTATVSGTPTYNGLVNGDTFSVTGAVTWAFPDVNVGTGKSLTRTGTYNAPSVNYTVTQPTLSADITVKTITISAASIASKVYNGSAASGTVTPGTLSGLVGAETLTVTATGLYANADAGIGKTATVSYVLTNGTNGGLATNYSSLADGTATGDITKATPAFTTTPISVGAGSSYSLPGSISPTSDGVLTYSITSGGFATLSGTTINGVSAGSETLTVNQAASTNYIAGSTTVPVTVTAITYVNGDWISRSDGTWDNKGTGTTLWKKRVSGAWVDQTSGVEPSGTSDAYTVYIANTVTIPTSTTALGTAKLYVMQGGSLEFASSGLWTIRNIIIDNGGTLQATTRFTTLSSGNFEIKDGGTFVFNYASNAMASTSVTSSILAGIENFHPNSNFIIKDHDTGSGIYVLPPAANITANTFNGITAYFGNLIIQKSDIRLAATNLSNTSTYLTHGNLEFSSISATTLFYGTGTWIVGGDLKLNNTLTGNITVTSGSTVNLNVKGNVVNNSANNLRIVSAAGTSTLAVDKDIILNSGVLDMNGTSGGTGTVTLKGNLTVAPSASILATNATTAAFNFAGTGDGLTATTTQTIDVASTGATRTTNIAFNVNSGAYVKLINQDLALGSNSKFNVAGTLDFGLNGSTALNIIPVPSSTGTAFTTSSGDILKITSADGINKTGATTGNVRTATITFNNVGAYHYIGALTPQSTGNAIENTGTAAALNLVINKTNTTDVVNLNTNTKTTGELNIIKGTFVETEANKIAGTTGKLTMSADAIYKTAVTSANTPQLTGAYTLASGSTIELNANSNQNFNATNTITYRNLIFSNGGTKTIGNTNENVVGTVTIKDNTIVDASSNTFGGTGTNLTMSDTSKLILGSGTDPKPRMDGVYSLGSSSTIEFTGTSSTQIRVSAATNPIQYAKVIVSGNNVKAGTTTTAGLTFQSGGVFTITGNGVYKVPNSGGFSGGTNTAIKNTNNPTINLETGSAVDYNGTTDQTITVATVATPATGNYQNLTISGSGVKSPVANLTVNDVTTVSAGTLKISATQDTALPNVFTAKKGLKNTGGTVILENNANLLQDAIVNNSGNITAQRSAKLKFESVSKADYNYWSSPVINQKLLYNTATPLITSFSPGTPNNRIFEYKESNDTFVATANPVFVAGKGYAIRAENGQNGSTYTADGIAKTFEFVGEPNNGDVSTPSLAYSNATHGYNLVGNPYPSIIDFNLLHSANSDLIGSTAYFWTNVIYTPSQQGSSSTGYTGSNYATFNGVGGVSAGGSSLEPTKYIKTGQGFIVQAKKAGQLNFTNAMRQTGISPFFNNKVDDEKNRFWVTLVTPSDMTNTILIGYVEGATNGFEKDYDAPILVNGSDSFYSVLGNEKLVIQGKSNSFSSDDIISVGAKYYETGIHKIQLKKKEGIFNGNQNVYLKDKLLNKVVNLSNGDYTFQTTKGTTDTRFEIVYKEDAVLGIGSDLKSDFVVYRDGNDFVIKSSKTLGKIEVYDAAGRMVVAQKTTDKILRLNASTLAEGMFIIKAENSGDVKTKKILK